MRHSASLIVAMEDISRPAFRIAKELCQNSRSGLTSRFLAKKLELPEEEIEYLVDLHHRLFFLDITKVKIVSEGVAAVKRISEGMESLGDVPALFRKVKGLSAHEFRRLEEQIGTSRPGGKKAAAEELLERYHIHPESVVAYVATRDFSATAQEVFDIVWQSKEGIMPVPQIRAAHGGSEYEVEQALWELFRGHALFELFRFDSEDRLVRAAGLLSELRQWREATTARKKAKSALKALRKKPDFVSEFGLGYSDRVCRLVAAVAAKPARLRGDGDLFREDRRRLGEICAEDDEPSLNTCLWVAQGAGWIARVDNELRANDVESLIALDRVSRHKIMFDWLVSTGNEAVSRRTLAPMLEQIKIGAWYPVMDFIENALRLSADNEVPVLKSAGGHWHYTSPSASPSTERALARSLEETLFWAGVVDRAEYDEGNCFRLTELGRCLLLDEPVEQVAESFPTEQAQFVVQPNFDIVVPIQDTDPLLTVPLDQFAERVSTGQAIVYRLSKDSFTRAVQQGLDGGAFVEFLLNHSKGKRLPRNVTTTLEDWRGGMKRVRLRTIQVIEAEDPLVMADLTHRRRFAKHLTPVDPKLVVRLGKVSKAELRKDLEKEGFVVE